MSQVIRLFTCSGQSSGVITVTIAEYEAMMNELVAKELCGDLTTGDRILAAVLLDASWRYAELKRAATGVTEQ